MDNGLRLGLHGIPEGLRDGRKAIKLHGDENLGIQGFNKKDGANKGIFTETGVNDAKADIDGKILDLISGQSWAFRDPA